MDFQSVENHIVEREMTISHAEFYRLIVRSIQKMSDVIINKNESIVKFPFCNGEITIELGNQTSRGIGSLILPVTVIKINFNNLSNDEIDEYLYKFNITFQRGGG